MLCSEYSCSSTFFLVSQLLYVVAFALVVVFGLLWLSCHQLHCELSEAGFFPLFSMLLFKWRPRCSLISVSSPFQFPGDRDYALKAYCIELLISWPKSRASFHSANFLSFLINLSIRIGLWIHITLCFIDEKVEMKSLN